MCGIRLFNCILICLLVITHAAAQPCSSVYAKADSLFKKDQYDLALKKLAAYKLCNPAGIRQADSLIILIYETINKQKQEAIRQRNIANQRATVIAAQKDSIERENIANIAATQALQINETDPSKAIRYIVAGLCFSPGNPSLLEINKKILAGELLRKDITGCSIFSTSTIEKAGRVLITGDANGYLRVWNSTCSKRIDTLKVLAGSLSAMAVIDTVHILVSGNDSRDYKHPVYVLKVVNRLTHATQTIASDLRKPYHVMAVQDDSSGNVVVGNELGGISRFSFKDNTLTAIKDTGRTIIGIQCFRKLQKIFYATPDAVYDLNTGRQIYKMRENSFITYLGSCEETGYIYIGMGPDLIMYDYLLKKEHLLYSIHQSMITSCHCAAGSGGGFMTTSHDGYAVLWTSNGNMRQVMKGNKSELYDGYLAENGDYAITVGRRDMSLHSTDTNTMKYWYLKGCQKKIMNEVQPFGATAVVCIDDHYITSGNDGKINVWNTDMELEDFVKVTDAGVSKLVWDDKSKKIVYGSFSGTAGTVALAADGKLGKPEPIQAHTATGITGLETKDGNVYSIGRDGLLLIQSYAGKGVDSVYFDVALNDIRFSPGKKNILLAAGNNALLYDPVRKTKVLFDHGKKVNALAWISSGSFATISEQYLYIWSVKNHLKPLLRVDNNIRNMMMSLYVDTVNRQIYTGTWSGYVLCWDYSGHQFFEFGQLAGNANTNIIQSIDFDRKHSRVVTADYNGNIGVFSSPHDFLEKELNVHVDCNAILKALK